MKSAYVYYRIDPAQAALAADRIDALLSVMAGHCGQPPRRMSRCDDPETWLEVYEGIADVTAFATALKTAVQTFDCTAFILGERHLECFSLTGSGPPGPSDPRS